MKIYKHVYDSYKQKVDTYEVVVEEKPKTYFVTKNVLGVWESRIHKEEIDKLGGHGIYKMFTLTPDPTLFIKAMLECSERHIELLKEQLNKAVAKKSSLLKLLNNEEEAATTEWDRMTDEEKDDFCSHCGCAYFYLTDVNQCMYDSGEFPFDTERPCLQLQRTENER